MLLAHVAQIVEEASPDLKFCATEDPGGDLREDASAKPLTPSGPATFIFRTTALGKTRGQSGGSGVLMAKRRAVKIGVVGGPPTAYDVVIDSCGKLEQEVRFSRRCSALMSANSSSRFLAAQ